MSCKQADIAANAPHRFMRRLARDTSGNTLALMAAAIFPLMGMVGGGIDMGRAYLASSRLQQACDAGVLAARKQLGTEAAVDGNIPESVAFIGHRFFNVNFREGTYGTEDRDFQMALESNFAISGSATAEVPTSIMRVFGFESVPLAVTCEAELSVANLDVMMVLDVTGSMRHTNDGDTQSRMDSLKAVIRRFHAQLESAKAIGSRVRYGFVPYATNVNVGHLLEDSWVTDQWTYQSREDAGTTQSTVQRTWDTNWILASGTQVGWVDVSSYPATYHAGTPPSGAGTDTSTTGTSSYYTCDNATPASTYSQVNNLLGTSTTTVTDPDGTRTIENMETIQNGTAYNTSLSGTTCTIQSLTFNDLRHTFDRITEPVYQNATAFTYKPMTFDVTNWRTETEGCIEERATYPINDYTNVDLTRALDLDIDLVPNPGDPDTQWRPRYPEKIYARSFRPGGNGSFSIPEVTTTDNYADTGNWWFSHCPAQARKLDEMTTEDLDTYLTTLQPYGATYHDIGMIWGGRLMSPTGLFASENQDVAGVPSGRHMIFLTDGQTEPYDLAYGAYGVEGLDVRRWAPGGSATLAETVEARFAVACEEVKKRNINVWVIAFGTYLNQSMLDCAGNGRYFEASNADDLNSAFASIARSIGDLRVSK